MSRCVIFGGADISDYGHIDRECVSESYVIAADRGIMHCEKLGIVPDMIVGDFDSSDFFRENMSESKPVCRQGELDIYDVVYKNEKIKLIKAPSEKDDTDTLLAVKYAIGNDLADEIWFYGCMGGRFGHSFANVQMLSYLSERGIDAVLVTENEHITVQREGSRKYRNNGESYVSVFSLSEEAQIVLDGFKYSGEYTVTRSYPLGVSNEFCDGNDGNIKVIFGEILVILEK